jgi:ABC-type transport system involved in multi-copper enzyme maturation permease subunit
MILRQLRALVWKDMRLNRAIMILGCCMIFFAYLFSLGACVYLQRVGGGTLSFWKVISTSVPLVIGFAALTTALLGANVIAAEYADRSSTFLAYQPPSRQLVLLSKAISGLAPSLVMTGIGLTTLIVSECHTGAGGLAGTISQNTILLLSTSWLIFTASWCVGALSRSAAIGVCAGIFLPVALGVAISNIAEDQRSHVFNLAAFVFGTFLFGAATVAVMHREEG